MCAYQEDPGHPESKCTLDKVYSQQEFEGLPFNTKFKTLPIDKEGFCLFHSRDLEWKRQHNFEEILFDYFKTLGVYDAAHYHEVVLCGFQFVGKIGDKNHAGWYDSHDRDFEENKIALEIHNVLMTDHIKLIRCEFHDIIKVNGFFHRGNLTFLDCIFHQMLIVDHLHVSGELAFESCHFHKEFLGFDGFIGNKFFMDKTTLFQTTIRNFHFVNDFIIMDSELINSDESTSYLWFADIDFRSGIGLDNNKINGTMTFEHCQIYQSSGYYFNEIDTLHFTDTDILSDITFSGKDDVKLFVGESGLILDLEPENIHDGGMLVFDHTNIFNISGNLKQHFKSLEGLQKIRVSYETCELFRNMRKLEFSYQESEILKDFITDFFNFLSRFFQKNESFDLDLHFADLKHIAVPQIIIGTNADVKFHEFWNKVMNFGQDYSRIEESTFENSLPFQSLRLYSKYINELFTLLSKNKELIKEMFQQYGGTIIFNYIKEQVKMGGINIEGNNNNNIINQIAFDGNINQNITNYSDGASSSDDQGADEKPGDQSNEENDDNVEELKIDSLEVGNFIKDLAEILKLRSDRLGATGKSMGIKIGISETTFNKFVNHQIGKKMVLNRIASYYLHVEKHNPKLSDDKFDGKFAKLLEFIVGNQLKLSDVELASQRKHQSPFEYLGMK